MKRERIINDDALLHLTYESLTGLTDEMMCVICMEVVKDTMATECLHRYCRGTDEDFTSQCIAGLYLNYIRPILLQIVSTNTCVS